MNRGLKVLLSLVGMIFACVIFFALLTPWMDRWGATEAELEMALPGDELVPNPASVVTRAVTIQAAAGQVYPWIVQLGADKGGMYSYAWLETLIACPQTNADRIHPEWQDLQVGDPVKMCPDGSGPPPYLVAQLIQDKVIVLGHKENEKWVDLWQFVLLPQADGTTRLVLRTTTQMSGGIWTLIHPGVFIMERAMLLGIQERAEAIGTEVVTAPVTPTPEIFIRLDPQPTSSPSELPLTCQVTDLNVYIHPAGYCFAFPPGFLLDERAGGEHPSIRGRGIGGPGEPVHAAFTLEVEPFAPELTLQQQVDNFLKSFTIVEPNVLNQYPLTVAGEPAILVDMIPVQLSWRIVFFEHEGQLYRMMYWPVDVLEATTDIDLLFQTTQNTFAFTK